MDDREGLIKSTLGEDAEPFEYVVSGRTRRGWRAYVPDDRDSLAGLDAALAKVERWWRQLHDADLRLFVGSGVFRLPSGEYVDGVDAREWPDPSSPSFPPAFQRVFALPALPTFEALIQFMVGAQRFRLWWD